MAEAPERLRAQQFALTRHLRDPQASPAPEGFEDRRLAVYRELLFNNIEGLLSGNFPVIRKLLGDERWKALIRDFYRDYRCHTPLFPEIAREFLRYLEARAEDGLAGREPSFLQELAHYEWVELALPATCSTTHRCCRLWHGRWRTRGRSTGSAPTSSPRNHRLRPPCCCCGARVMARCAFPNSARWRSDCCSAWASRPS
jgi:hypothetical protein